MSNDSSTTSSSLSAAASVLHTHELLLHIFIFLPFCPTFPTVACVCKDWFPVLEREELWVVVIKAQAPHLLQTYRLLQRQQQQRQRQQRQGQEASGESAAVPTYRSLFRGWLELDDWPDEETRMGRWRACFDGCFLIVSVFSDEDMTKLVGSRSIDLQDEDLLHEFFNRGLRMEGEDGDPQFFDLEHVWGGDVDEVNEDDEEDELDKSDYWARENREIRRIRRMYERRQEEERRIEAKANSLVVMMYLLDSKSGRMCRLADFSFVHVEGFITRRADGFEQPYCHLSLQTVLSEVLPRLAESKMFCYIRFVWPAPRDSPSIPKAPGIWVEPDFLIREIEIKDDLDMLYEYFYVMLQCGPSYE